MIAETFIRTLKNKIFKYMTSFSKNAYNDKLDNIINKYNNTYIDSSKEIINKNSKFNTSDTVRISGGEFYNRSMKLWLEKK